MEESPLVRAMVTEWNPINERPMASKAPARAEEMKRKELPGI